MQREEQLKTILTPKFAIKDITQSDDYRFDTSEISHETKEIDYLIFFDSRGARSNQESESLYDYIIKELQAQGKTFVALNRPVGSTTFFTLVNMHNNGMYRYKKLITNLSFVDFTPKKHEVIINVVEQAKEAFPQTKIKINQFENITLSNGEGVTLENIDMFKYTKEVSSFLSSTFERCFLINTPEIPETITFPRPRPRSFYQQILNANSFLNLVYKNSHNSTLIDISKLSPKEEIKYFIEDGVHYSHLFHQKIWSWAKNDIF